MAGLHYTDLLGKPFEYGGRGPDTYDCWGLVQEMERRNTGIALPDFRSPEALEEIAASVDDEKYRFHCFGEKTGPENVPYSVMQPGRVLLLRVRGLACHVGYVHRRFHFLHAWEDGHGVKEEQIEIWRQRILGVYGVRA